jgi:hypothetical protein
MNSMKVEHAYDVFYTVQSGNFQNLCSAIGYWTLACSISSRHYKILTTRDPLSNVAPTVETGVRTKANNQ